MNIPMTVFGMSKGINMMDGTMIIQTKKVHVMKTISETDIPDKMHGTSQKMNTQQELIAKIEGVSLKKIALLT